MQSGTRDPGLTARRKWDKAHIATASTRLPIDTYNRARQVLADSGQNMCSTLRKHILSILADADSSM